MVLAARTVWSVVLTVSGCVVAGYGDLTFDPLGYATALMSCLLQVLLCPHCDTRAAIWRRREHLPSRE